MTVRKSKKTILIHAKRMADELETHWPGIRTRIGLQTQEGEDAYIWITAPESVEDEIRSDASGLTVDVYETTGLYITPRMLSVKSA